MTRLVHRVGTNGDVHDTPIFTSYRRAHKSVTGSEAEFEDVNVDYTGLSFFFLSDCTSVMLAISLPDDPVPSPLGAANLNGKNGTVWKSPPCTTSEDTSVIIKRPKTDPAGSRGRTRISDFDDLTKSLADETISIYQAQIVAVQPWPSTAENWESISQAWIEVCTSRNVRIELDDEIFKVVRASFRFLFPFPASGSN